MDPFNILLKVSQADVKKIRTVLKRRKFNFSDRHYAYYSASKYGLHVTAYEKGPKVLVQGNDAHEFTSEVIDPILNGKAKRGKSA